MRPLILIADDEVDLARTLEYNLRREGFDTRLAHSGLEVLEEVEREPQPALVLLDLMLPDIPGTEVCRRLRSNEATSSIAVVMVTAKGEEIDRVVGFEVGADDYVVKPFSIRELMLRIRAVLRRKPAESAQATAALPDEGRAQEEVAHGDLRLDLAGHVVTFRGHEVRLTALEFRLLKTLISRRGRVQSREQLLGDVWGYAPDVTTRTVDTHIKRLRSKLGDAGDYVETVRGVGYCVRPLGEG